MNSTEYKKALKDNITKIFIKFEVGSMSKKTAINTIVDTLIFCMKKTAEMGDERMQSMIEELDQVVMAAHDPDPRIRPSSDLFVQIDDILVKYSENIGKQFPEKSTLDSTE